MLEINKHNILGWVKLLCDIYPLTEEERALADAFFKKRKGAQMVVVNKIYKEVEG